MKPSGSGVIRWVLRVALGGALGVALVWGLTAAFPFQVQELKTRVELRLHGFRTVEFEGLRGWERNLCKVGAPCRCVGFLHGSGDTSLTWRRVMEGEGIPGQDEWKTSKLPVRLVALDLPGSGDSPAPSSPEGYRVKAMAEAVSRALGKACPTWTLVGNSFGGWVAAQVALTAPDQIVHLVLIAAAGLKTPPREPLRLFDDPSPTLEDLKEFQRRAYFKPRELPERVWKAAFERFQAGQSRVSRDVQTPEDYLDDRLPSLRAATLILWGEADRILPMTWGEYFKSRIPMSVLHKIEACGHMPQKECPGVVIRELQAVERLGTI